MSHFSTVPFKKCIDVAAPRVIIFMALIIKILKAFLKVLVSGRKMGFVFVVFFQYNCIARPKG